MTPHLASFPGYPLGVSKPLMEPEGRGTSGVLAFGEALGEHEEHDKLPFRPYAEAGSVLERALWRAGVPRDTLTITNLVWYRPPGNALEGTPWEMDAIRACKPFNDELVERVKPRCLLALGGLAFRELSGMTGPKEGITLCRGLLTPGFAYPGIPAVGTYHPSYLRRGSKERQKSGPQAKVEAAGGGTQGMALLGVLIRDIQLAVEIARNGPPAFKHDPYQLGATLDDWQGFYLDALAHPDLPISYDWETPTSARVLTEEEIEAGAPERDILQGQMSLRPGQAIVSRFTPDLLEIWRRILALPNPKLDWNGRKFDRPLAVAFGMPLAGELHDVMDMWHHAQPDLPRGLQYATSFFCPEVGPWKHQMGTDPLWYGALDVDMPQRVFAALRRSLGIVREPHSGVTLLRGYQDQVVRLAPVLDRMSARGMPVNESRRAELDKTFTATLAEIDAKMQTLAPEELRPVEPKEGFKRASKIPKACLEASGQLRLGESASDASSSPITQTRVSDDTGIVYVTRTFKDAKTKLPTQRWAKLCDFTPSPKQVLAYIKWRGYKVPRNVKTDKETTDELGLRRLIREHPSDELLPLVLSHREVEKARGTYVEGWKPRGVTEYEIWRECTVDPDSDGTTDQNVVGRGDFPGDPGGTEFRGDTSQTARSGSGASEIRRIGRVHSTFGFKPATGQLSSEDPNAQNFPKHAAIARSMRRMIEARPGHHLVSFDWKSFHVLTTGFEAQDPTYMRLARLDMHSFFALVGLLKLEPPEKVLELPDPELAAKLAWYRKQPRVWGEYACQGHPAGMTFAEIRDEKAKRTILGVGFGQSAMGMFKRNPESFGGLHDAQACLDMLNRVFPKPEAWRQKVRLEADANAFLLTRHGYVRRFWDVFARKVVGSNFQPRRGQLVLEGTGKRWLLGPGDDHEACVAYRPANDAFGIKRGVMVKLGELELDSRYGLINEIHDDLLFECPDERLDKMIPTVKAMMETPSPYLVDPLVAPEGLWCEVEVALGRNWDYKDSENPLGMEKLKI